MSVGKKGSQRDAVASSRRQPCAGSEDAFPDTQTDVLAQAAGGDWEPFLERYLRPMWREVVMACRSHGLPLSDADDLYQELLLRLIQNGRFNHEVRRVLEAGEAGGEFCGNLVSRFLKYRELPLVAARFHTFLKRVVRNVVLEAARKARRRPQQLAHSQWEALEPLVEQSLTSSLDRIWVSDCLMAAAWRFKGESESAHTRGDRRLFDILYLSTVTEQSPGKIAVQYGVDRTTIAGLLRRARERFLVLLGRLVGTDDREELQNLLVGRTEDLRAALALVQAHDTQCRREPPKNSTGGQRRT
jgi:DNA-directed RNA polymerase specialized sigma24 family protein